MSLHESPAHWRALSEHLVPCSRVPQQYSEDVLEHFLHAFHVFVSDQDFNLEHSTSQSSTLQIELPSSIRSHF